MSEAVVAFRKVLRATLEGRLLFLNNDHNGLNGNNNLDNNGRFVGIVKLNWLRQIFLIFKAFLIISLTASLGDSNLNDFSLNWLVLRETILYRSEEAA